MLFLRNRCVYTHLDFLVVRYACVVSSRGAGWPLGGPVGVGSGQTISGRVDYTVAARPLVKHSVQQCKVRLATYVK